MKRFLDFGLSHEQKGHLKVASTRGENRSGCCCVVFSSDGNILLDDEGHRCHEFRFSKFVG
jgi:hypothetical protein